MSLSLSLKLNFAVARYYKGPTIQSAWKTRQHLAEYAKLILTKLSRAVKEGNIKHIASLYRLALKYEILAPRIVCARHLLEACIERLILMNDLDELDCFRNLIAKLGMKVPLCAAARIIPIVTRLERAAPSPRR